MKTTYKIKLTDGFIWEYMPDGDFIYTCKDGTQIHYKSFKDFDTRKEFKDVTKLKELIGNRRDATIIIGSSDGNGFILEPLSNEVGWKVQIITDGQDRCSDDLFHSNNLDEALEKITQELNTT